MNDLPPITIEGINIGKRLARCDAGYGEIKCFLDANGDETQDASVATIAIIEWVAGGWSYAIIDEFTDSMN